MSQMLRELKRDDSASTSSSGAGMPASETQEVGIESFSKLQSDDAPLLCNDAKDPSPSDQEGTLEEMERKYAAFVRHDTYGTMGRGDVSIWEKALLVLALLTIVPVKVVLLLTILVTYYIVCRVCTLFKSPYQNGVIEEENNNNSSLSPIETDGKENNSDVSGQFQESYANMSGLRRWIIVHTGQFIARLALFVLGFYWIKVTHLNKEEDFDQVEGEYILPGAVVSNHVSYVDILYHMSASFPSFVAKQSVARLPLVGLISKCLGCVYVQREGKPSDFKGVSGLITQQIQAACRDKNAPRMLIFPEGTTTNGHYLLPFKTGAFLAQAPVQPVFLKYLYRRFSPAWDTISGARHIVILLCQFINHLEVTWLPVYFPSDEEKSDPTLFANNVRKLMAMEGGLMLADTGLHEKRIYHAYLRDLDP